MDRQQMELSFGGEVQFRPARRGERRISRAGWWFEQMYRAVERAPDWAAQFPTKSARILIEQRPAGGVP